MMLLFVFTFFLTDTLSFQLDEPETYRLHAISNSQVILFQKESTECLRADFKTKQKETLSFAYEITDMSVLKNQTLCLLSNEENRIFLYDIFFQLKDEIELEDRFHFMHITPFRDLFLFDEDEYRLVLLNIDSRQFIASRTLVNTEINPIRFREYGSFIMLVGSKENIVFNRFGVPVQELQDTGERVSYKETTISLMEQNLFINQHQVRTNVVTFDLFQKSLFILLGTGAIEHISL